MGKKAKKSSKAGKKPPATTIRGKSTKAKLIKGKLIEVGAFPADLVAPPESAPLVQESSAVDLWFDPRCPWAWLASRWMLEVETMRPVKTFFHVMSLAVLNERKDISADYRQELDQSWPAVRVTLAVGQQYGQEQLAAFYTAIGTRIHVRGEGEGRDTIAGALADVGLPPELIELGDVGDNDDALRTSTWDGMNLVGLNVGAPVLQVNGRAFFGPVFSPRPRGEEAGRV